MLILRGNDITLKLIKEKVIKDLRTKCQYITLTYSTEPELFITGSTITDTNPKPINEVEIKKVIKDTGESSHIVEILFRPLNQLNILNIDKEQLRSLLIDEIDRHSSVYTGIVEVIPQENIELRHPLMVVSKEESICFNYEWNKTKVENIKYHFRGKLLELYPSGLSLNVDNSNYQEYEYYKCLLDLIQNTYNFTDTMNISAKYDVKLYRNTYQDYRDIQYLCGKFNAILLNLLIIRKFDGKSGLLKSATKLTGKTLDFYLTGYLSAYNKNTIMRINRELGCSNYLMMV